VDHPDLTISIARFNGISMVSVSGVMDAWHSFAIDVAVNSFIERAERELVIDAANLEFTGPDGMKAFLGSLRALPQEIHVHVAASMRLAQMLRRANLGPCISVSIGLDDLAEDLTMRQGRYLASRWLSQMPTDRELPLAA